MLETVLIILILALVLLIVWWVIGMFVSDPRIKNVIGVIFALILLIYALNRFFPSLLA